MLATLLLELGLPDAPHRDCLRFRGVVPPFIAEVFARHGIDFEAVKPMGSLRRLAFLVEGIPTLTNAVTGWVPGPVERVGRTSDGSLTPVTTQFLQRLDKRPDDLEVREVDGVRRLGVEVHRKAVLSATVLPAALTELMDVIAASERLRVGKGVDFADAVQWIVALLGDARVRFRWRTLESDRYTYNSAGGGTKILVPHFYEYHAVLAQAGIRVDEATRRDHLLRELNAAAADFGGRCVLIGDQLEQLSLRLDEPAVHLHRGLPLELSSGFVQAVAFASTYCVAVRRSDGGLAPGWLVVSEAGQDPNDDGEGESEVAHRAFSRVMLDAEAWLRSKVNVKVKRQVLATTSRFIEFVAQHSSLNELRPDVVSEAAWYCLEAQATEAFACFPGTHLLLARQRAGIKRASPRAIELLDELIELVGVETGQPNASPSGVAGDVAVLFVVVTFHDLVQAFLNNQAPLAERDPGALRWRTEVMFGLLLKRRWPLPMQESVERAVSAWGESVTSIETALLGFLRHRATRYLQRIRPNGDAKVPPRTGEWSLLAVSEHRA